VRPIPAASHPRGYKERWKVGGTVDPGPQHSSDRVPEGQIIDRPLDLGPMGLDHNPPRARKFETSAGSGTPLQDTKL
jgi:hypothetical protein